ncbi:hypothetical protein HNP38_003289 [Chryseobacterium defluvii]|uniref:YD repeat-containing protein n=1 Tax=Chryseobacterium defluvii TaxID=160396 RepID=A0A840KEG3_9FLAO|nr:hypothetical protein [Chryseobacterium defluvii]MBB4807949.1 hypothetical protein [Chryseobacterium defluvii]
MIKNLLKNLPLILVLQSTIIYCQIKSDTIQSQINLKQKVIDANYQKYNSQKINDSGLQSKTSNLAQNPINHNDYYYDEINSLTSSAESNDIFRIEQFNNDLYTGTQDIKIPLFSIQEGDITIPIILTYHTTGIKVDQKASEVGLGWSLIKGPQINRKINIINDWFETNGTIPTYNPRLPEPIGYFRKIRENLPISLYGGTVHLTESLPDEYYVSLKGGMRKFIFTDENSPEELTKTGLKIQALTSNFPNFSNFLPKDFNEFRIIDNDGLKYTFINGGFRKTSSETMELTTSTSSFHGQPISVSDWKVSKIEDVLNNTAIDFEYIINNNSESYPSSSENSYANCSLFTGYYGNPDVTCEKCIILPSTGAASATYKFAVNYNVNILESKKYISKIIYSNGSLVFNYDISNPDYILKSIEQFDKQNRSIKKFTFNYSYFDCVNNTNDLDVCQQRLKLISLGESNKGKYEFFYNNLPLYSYTTSRHDFLGYHTDGQINDNGKGLYYYPGEKEWSILPYDLPIPPMTPDGQFERQKIKIFNNDQSSPYDLKVLPSSNYAKAGILEKIKFPTGGEQSFQYEMNDFLLFGKYEVQGAGLRIKETYLKDQNTIEKRIRYEYKESNNKSSGLLLAPPFIGYPLMTFDMGSNFTEIMDEQNSTISMYFSLYNKTNSNSDIINGSIVGYGRVTKKYDDGSYEEFVFKNDNQNYDLVSQHFSSDSVFPNTPNDYIYGDFKVNNSADLIKYKNFDSYGNGNLLTKSIYNNTGTLIKRIANSYRNNQFTTLKAAYPSTTVFGRINPDEGNFQGLHSWNYGTYRVKYLSYFNDVISSTKTDYYPSGNKSETATYIYIDNYSNKLRKVEKSDGIITEKKYLFDSNYPIGSPEANLQYQFNDIYATESEKTTVNGKTINKQVVKYNNFLIGNNTVPKPSELYKETLSGAEDNIFKILSYNSKGKIIETLMNGIPAVTVWGYNDTLPIVKIVGATYSQVSGYISDIIYKSNMDIDLNSENNLISALDIFRTNPIFNNVEITTYTYDPLIGVTSVTSPSGLREIYKYNSSNRLEKIVDKDGNIIKEFKYNYKQ